MSSSPGAGRWLRPSLGTIGMAVLLLTAVFVALGVGSPAKATSQSLDAVEDIEPEAPVEPPAEPEPPAVSDPDGSAPVEMPESTAPGDPPPGPLLPAPEEPPPVLVPEEDAAVEQGTAPTPSVPVESESPVEASLEPNDESSGVTDERGRPLPRVDAGSSADRQRLRVEQAGGVRTSSHRSFPRPCVEDPDSPRCARRVVEECEATKRVGDEDPRVCREIVELPCYSEGSNSAECVEYAEAGCLTSSVARVCERVAAENPCLVRGLASRGCERFLHISSCRATAPAVAASKGGLIRCDEWQAAAAMICRRYHVGLGIVIEDQGGVGIAAFLPTTFLPATASSPASDCDPIGDAGSIELPDPPGEREAILRGEEGTDSGDLRQALVAGGGIVEQDGSIVLAGIVDPGARGDLGIRVAASDRAVASDRRRLPMTGFEPALLALSGVLLLAAGTFLRRRVNG